MIYVFYAQNDFIENQFKDISFIPLSKIKFIDFDINLLLNYEYYVFTSKNAITSLVQQIEKSENKEYYKNVIFSKNIICVGVTTEKIARKYGFKNIQIPTKAYGKNLFEEFENIFKNTKAIFLRGEIIASNPKYVDEIIVYKNIKIQKKESSFKIKNKDIIIFTSPMLFQFYKENNIPLNKSKIIAIGKTTKKAIKKYSKKVYTPKETTLNACIKLALKLQARQCKNL